MTVAYRKPLEVFSSRLRSVAGNGPERFLHETNAQSPTIEQRKNTPGRERKMEGTKTFERPTIAQLNAELKREDRKKRYNKTLRSTTYALIVVAAIAVLVATIFLPVLRVYGSSMTPTLSEGEVVVSVKESDFKQGEVVALWYGNKLLVKRVIAGPGQWVDIDKDGNVFVDGEMIDEPYLLEKAMGDCNITLPYQVMDGRYFVLGDHRATSQDSRSSIVGCIAEEQIVGKIVFRVWPLSAFGYVE